MKKKILICLSGIMMLGTVSGSQTRAQELADVICYGSYCYSYYLGQCYDVVRITNVKTGQVKDIWTSNGLCN